MSAVAELDARLRGLYVGADPHALTGELRRIVDAAILGTDRNQQTAIGPSGLGNPCTRCLVHELAGDRGQDGEAPWLPAIGTAVHEWLEGVMLRRGADTLLTESRVTVGHVGGTPITGTSDLFDIASGTVVDWKVLGTTTMRKLKSHGAPAGYRHQLNLYGKGWEDAGYTVRHCVLYALPRNGLTLADANPVTWEYDRADAEATLARANQWAALSAAAGIEVALTAAGPHTGDEFTCRRHGYKAPTRTPARNVQVLGLTANGQ